MVEVLLAASIFSLLITALVGAFIYGQDSSALAGTRIRAGQLADEGLEASRSIRDGAFTNLVDGSHGLAVSGNVWTYSGTQDVAGQFTRSVTVSTVDANTKELTSTVNWQQNAQRTGTASAATRLTNWAAAVAASWANPNTLAGNLNLAGLQDGLKIAIQSNYAYVVRNDGTPDFAVINITNPASPTLVGSLALAGIPRNIVVSGNYAYIASSDNAQELKVINVTNPAAPVQVGSYNASGNSDANGVFMLGTTVYLVRTFLAADPEFVIVNVANPAAPVLLGTAQLSDTSNEVYVQGTAAYVVSNSNTQELQVVNVANPAAPVQVANINFAGTSNALTLAGLTNRLFVGQGNVLHVVNTTTPLAPVLLGSFSAGGVVNDISLILGNGNTHVFIATASATAEFQVVDVSVPATPVLVGTYNTLGVLNGIAYDGATDRAYAVGAANAQEFTVVQP
ncbi:MAG: hypothetical protein Q8O51_01590 [bacterium]|nr:hypothetical protein [bacterium]